MPGSRASWAGSGRLCLGFTVQRRLTNPIEILYNPAMSEIEWRGIEPEEMIREIEDTVRLSRENKYAFQVGLKDLDFDVDHDQLTALGISIPFRSIDQAEQALSTGVITPTIFVEDDDTRHQVLAFDHRPVGYSGFMDCVTHSLALTDQGLFEVGRYPAVSLSSESRSWQWFLHRRLATSEEVSELFKSDHLPSEQLLEKVYQAFISG